MINIVDRLRDMADLFEAQQAPHNLVLHLRIGADEIDRLRAGGCARDQGLTQYCAEAATLTARVAELEEGLVGILWMAEEWFEHTGSSATFSDDYEKELEAARATISTLTPMEKT